MSERAVSFPARIRSCSSTTVASFVGSERASPVTNGAFVRSEGAASSPRAARDATAAVSAIAPVRMKSLRSIDGLLCARRRSLRVDPRHDGDSRAAPRYGVKWTKDRQVHATGSQLAAP